VAKQCYCRHESPCYLETCLLSRGHKGKHRSDGVEWTTEEGFWLKKELPEGVDKKFAYVQPKMEKYYEES